ncbi:hypothetical protein PHLCEN_2v9004 [Hermanssonia centrifuga]|uniref:Cytochrome P450 n=1 Tax=Hermanssonia centrifuga TaxID=98765 RepID=A0A2R6NS79_9APHY|nr:hypothetical protein PHLCEN_2v9004 [Hermanssonia centrifuga]
MDSVVGRDRLLTPEDEKNLPYIRAIIKEIERVHNSFWLGTPHMSTEDFNYRGTFIPKNTVVILNTVPLIPKSISAMSNIIQQWTMHNDPKRFPEPEKFNPDRYLDDHLTNAKSANLADPMQRDHWMSGAGSVVLYNLYTAFKGLTMFRRRRICSAIPLAEQEIFLAVAHMLWAFEMQQLPEEPIDLKEYDGLSGRFPVPFHIKMIPRDEHVAEVLYL